jgi:hypothetical protein
MSQVVSTKRTSSEWAIFVLIHLIFIGGIAITGFIVYGMTLGVWVAASAIVAGLALTHMFANDIPGEKAMKIIVYVFSALNAAYIVHNGAQQIGVESYNAAQIKKYEVAMSEAAQARTGKIASAMGLSAKDATELEKVFDNEVATIASILAFCELLAALVVFTLGSSRKKKQTQAQEQIQGEFASVTHAEQFNGNHSGKV